MRRIVIMATIVAAFPTVLAGGTFAQPPAERERVELSRALDGAWLPLESGLALGAEQGTPISAKYEIEDGALQLSVYTARSDGASAPTFSEVIVDYSAGMLTRVEPLHDEEDVAAARSEQAAMTGARRSLERITADIVRANPGFRAVSVVATRHGAGPVAEVTLVNSGDWKVVTAPLD